MADEAFALSPIHARASLPTDGDYDAICEAFMETSRGRWFLTEYAKRNRNADTRMVLDAIERIEQSLASQRQAQAEAQKPAPVQAEAAPQVDLWPELAKAFTRARIEIAQRLVRESNEQAFEAIRASVETIKSVSWALRERGFDARICDFFDVQVNAITDGYTGLVAESSVASDTEAEVLAAFDALIDHVEGLTNSRNAETDALDVIVDAVADAMNEDFSDAIALDDDATATAAMPAEEPAAPTAEVAPAVEAAEPGIVSTNHVLPAPDTDAAFREIYGDDGDIEFVETGGVNEPAAIPTEPEINKQRLYEAKIEPYRPPAGATGATASAQVGGTSSDDIEIVDIAVAEPEPVARANPAPIDQPISHAAPMPAAAPAARPNDNQPAPPGQTATAQAVQGQAAVGQPSLGHALLASGVIQNPSRSDPLAPFRRMSQAEKIAFFT
jgi:hypothetical protein